MADASFLPRIRSERSPYAVIHECLETAVSYAALGHISHSVEIINLATQLGPLNLRFPRQNGLYFAWEAAGLWPSIVPEEEKTTEYLRELDESQTLLKWSSPANQSTTKYERLEVNQAGLDQLLPFIRGGKEPQGVLRYEYSETLDLAVDRRKATFLALDIALRLGGHEEDVDFLFSIINEKSELSSGVPSSARWMHDSYVHNIAKSRSAWTLLKKGQLAREANDRPDVDTGFQKLKDALTTRIEKGVQSLSHYSMLELLLKLDENTICHDDDESLDGIQ
jgi:hypothetical protein